MYDIVAENDYDRRQPMATLTLRYASREVLIAKGIIPRKSWTASIRRAWYESCETADTFLWGMVRG